MRRFSYILMALMLAMSFIIIATTAQAAEDYVEGEALVVYDSSATGAEMSAIRARHAVRSVRHVPSARFERLRLAKGKSVRDAVDALNKEKGVLFAEPNYIRRASGLPNDTRLVNQWGLDNTGQTLSTSAGLKTGTPDADMDAPEAWDINTGSKSVVVAVLDSGIDSRHFDLADNLWQNPGEANCADAVDEDGNGYLNDCWGWDFVDGDSNPTDIYGHGTHVAGIVGGKGGNSYGITGVMQDVSLMSIRILDASGYGTVADEVQGIYYAQAKGAQIINLSLGGSAFSLTEYYALSSFISSGGLVVAAAGNDGINTDVTPEYPASYDLAGILSVAATDMDDNLSVWSGGLSSNYGPTTVDVAAPGSYIYSSVMTSNQIGPTETFDSVMPAGWINGGTNDTWGVVGNSLSDSPIGSYIANTASWVNSPSWSLLSESNCFLYYSIKYDIASGDTLIVNGSLDNSTWSQLASYTAGTSGGAFLRQAIDIFSYSGGPFYLQFAFTSDGATEADGVYIDDLSIRCALDFGWKNGTSMATPAVAGVAGLLKSQYSWATGTTLAEMVMMTVDELPSLSGKLLTSGRVNAHNALLPLPVAPSGLTATAGLASISLSWTDNSTDELGFRVERRSAFESAYATLGVTAAGAVSYTDGYAIPGYTYYYRVRSYNSTARSFASADASAMIPAASGGGSGGSSGCFIATAAYGSYMEPEVMALRQFRDELMLTNAPGRWLVSLYYEYSPPLAAYISDRPALRAMTRAALAPVVYTVKSPASALAAIFFTLALALGLRARTTRNIRRCGK